MVVSYSHAKTEIAVIMHYLCKSEICASEAT
jgi:hypothetical protein